MPINLLFLSLIRTFAWIFGTQQMNNKRQQWWKTGWSVGYGVVTFLACLLPLRALLNYHEQRHLFRWSGYYLREQTASWNGWQELAVSFLTQFFYVGWLGALLVALLAVGVQWLVWRLMCFVRLRRWWLYPLSLVPSAVLVYVCLLPPRYRQSAEFRELISYDYLMRTHQWETITERAATTAPQSEFGVLATNHALAMQGRLPDDMFLYRQTGPKGLLFDDQQQEPQTLYTLSDIHLRLGFVNEAERLAFNGMQQLPDHHKSGRLLRRLAETNIINGDYRIARKYLNFLASTLYYGSWARRWLSHLGDEAFVEQQYGAQRQRRTADVNHLVAPDKSVMLTELVRQDSTNRTAVDYLLAYDLLSLKYERLLDHLRQVQQLGYYSTMAPRAVQECIMGNWVLYHPDAKELPIPVSEEVYQTTRDFIQTVSKTQNVDDPSLSEPPFSQSYWHYHVVTLQQQNNVYP